jgi:hypothetical protein
MATSFTLVSSWTGRIKGEFETSKSYAYPEGIQTAAEGYIYLREVETVALRRVGQDITSFASVAGTMLGGADIIFYSGTDLLTGKAGRNYICTENEISPIKGTNIWEETQVWKYVSDWEEYRLDTWEPTN